MKRTRSEGRPARPERGARSGARTPHARSFRQWAANPWVVASVLAVAAIGLSALHLTPHLSTIGDDAQYIVLGESLLAGKGLCHVNDPAEKPDTKYPFLFPLLLAGVLGVWGYNLAALKMVSVLSSAAAAWLYYPLFRRHAGAGVALSAAVLATLSPDILGHGAIVLAEVPYLFVSFAALAWVTLAEGRWRERRWVPVALLLVGAAYYLKAVGLALAAALFVYLLLTRRRRWAFCFLAGFVLLALPWAIRNARIGGGQSYGDYFLMRDPYRPDAGVVSAGELLARVGGNIAVYTRQIIPEALVPFARSGGPPVAGWVGVLCLGVSALTALGLVRRLARRRTLPDLYLLFFLAVCALWPRVWAAVRFVVPVLPLLFLSFLAGLSWLVSGFRRDPSGAGGAAGRFPSGALAVATAVLAVGALHTGFVDARNSREYPPDWQRYSEAAEWVRDHTPPESVVICRKPYDFYLTSGRRAMGYVFSDDPAEVIAGIEKTGATHVVVDRFAWTGTTARYLWPAIQSQPERFPLAYATEREPTTYVTRFVGKPAEEAQ